jgi:glycosyltransferase involved in cell wall biosynthesis
MNAGRRVRVLFLNDTARNGGPGRSLYYILRFLDPAVVSRAVVLPRPGVISELLSGRATEARVVDELHFARRLVENPIEPWTRPMVRRDFEAPLALRGARFAGNLVRGAAAVFELAAVVRRGRYDLLYCNGTNADFLGGAVAKVAGVPAIWHVRYSSVPKALRALHDRLAASPNVARILCVSRASASLFPHVPEKVLILHNALDVEEFSPSRVTPTLRDELALGPDVLVFGSQGRILRRKGYVEMVHAARIVLEQLTREERARTVFVVLGDTPQDLRPDHLSECRALVGKLGLEGKVHFLGFRPDVKPLVAAFDVAIVPSVYEDPLPRAVLESMALGKPVVAFDLGGVGEMVEDGKTGTLVRGRPPDVLGLARAMLRYARDPVLRAMHGRAGRERVVRNFDGAKQTRKIQDEIVEASGVGPQGRPEESWSTLD